MERTNGFDTLAAIVCTCISAQKTTRKTLGFFLVERDIKSDRERTKQEKEKEATQKTNWTTKKFKDEAEKSRGKARTRTRGFLRFGPRPRPGPGPGWTGPSGSGLESRTGYGKEIDDTSMCFTFLLPL